MLARIRDENFLKVRTANGQHDLVRLQQLPVACQCHVHQVAAIVEILETCGDVILEVVPAESKLIVHVDGWMLIIYVQTDMFYVQATLIGFVLYLLG